MIKDRRIELGLTLEDVGKAVGVGKSTVRKWESGQIKDMKRDKISALADVLRLSPVSFIVGEDSDKVSGQPRTAIPATGLIPIVGSIPAGYPLFESEDILGYQVAPVKNADEYFYLRVSGDSMINKGISDGCLVLLHKQQTAENGQVIACRVNGDEATLKVFQRQNDTVFLLPANPAFNPIIIPAAQFERGEAEIYGVVKYVMTEL